MVHDDWARATVEDAFVAMHDQDWVALDSLHRPDVVYESPHGGRVEGRDAVFARYRVIIEAVPDLRASTPRMIENDCRNHQAVFEYVQTGTLRSGGDVTPFVLPSILTVDFDSDGRIAHMRTVHASREERLSR